MNTQHVTATGGFAYGVIGADIHVFGDGSPLYVLENWRPPPETDAEWLREQPSRMLNARFAVVEFTGRGQELAEVRSWCTSGPLRAARWLHAPGGQGKSRLADELARQVSALGWKVAIATEGRGSVLPPPGSQDLRTAGSAGLLLLIDYADRWPFTTLTWLFSNALLHQPDMPTRVLLLGRSVDPWPALRASLANQQVSASTQALAPLDDSNDGQRAQMFRAACDGFADRYGITPPDQRVDLDDPGFGLTLTVHMAALVAVDALATGRTAAQDVAGLTVYLLDREHLGWARLHQGGGPERINTPPPVMNRAVFVACLAGAQPKETGSELLESLHLGHPSASVLVDHAVCYPPPEAGTVLEPLYPDRLAEDFVALTMPGHSADYPAQPWSSDTAAAAIRHGARPGRPVIALAVAAARWPHVGRECLYPLLAADPGVAVAAGGAALAALAELADIPPEVLEDVASRIPVPVPPDMATGQATVQIRLLEHRLARTDDPAAHARLYVDHGNDLRTLGRYEEALAAAEQGVELFEDLAAADARRYDADVGRALTNLANRLSEVGRQDEAVAAQERVLAIFRRLARDLPEDHEFDLATALANHSNHLDRAGRLSMAYQANREALAIYRRLALRNPRYRQNLAITLTNVGALTLLGPEDASDAVSEAVAIWRQLSQTDPETCQDGLAAALAHLHTHLSAADRHDEAISAIGESVTIYKGLAQAHPTAYLDLLAVALDLLRSSLTEAGRHDEAVAAAAEAVAVWRQLVKKAPETYQPSLLGALRRQNDALRAAGLPPDPEVDASSKKISLKDLTRHQPAITLHPRGWDPTTSAQKPSPPPQFDALATRLAKAKDWPSYWELVCSVPIADAIRLARRIPRRRWSPSDDGDRELMARLAATNVRRTETLVNRAAHAATIRLPTRLFLHEDYSAFAHGRAALVVATVERDQREAIHCFDIGHGRLVTLHRGEEADCSSIACLGPTEVVTFRAHGKSKIHHEFVRHTARGTSVLARGTRLAGAHVVSTATGCVVGLRLVPCALVYDERYEARDVDLAAWGLLRGDLLTVTPSGDRLVISDGGRLIAADAELRTLLAAATVPSELGEVVSMTFADEDLLLVSGRRGGLALWELNGTRPLLRIQRDTPVLRNLFAVPAWGIVGGKAHSQDHIHFFDSSTLVPATVPASVRPNPQFLKTFLSSPDGRFVAFSGYLDHRRSLEWSNELHDLHHLGAILQRPLGRIGPRELARLAAIPNDDARLYELCMLAHDVASRHVRKVLPGAPSSRTSDATMTAGSSDLPHRSERHISASFESVVSRVNRYRRWRNRNAVLGRGVLADAGPLWRAGMSLGGTSVEALHALAWLHWCRYRATRGEDLINDFQAALLLFARVGQHEPNLVPEELRPILERGVTVDHQFIGPEHWGRVGVHLLRQAETTLNAELLDQAVEIFEGTVAVYPPDHRFWPGDMRNLRYALRLRYSARRDPADRHRSIEVNRALRRGRSPNEPLGPAAPPIPPPPKVSRLHPLRDLEQRLQRVTELHDFGQHEVAEDEARDLLTDLDDRLGPNNSMSIRTCRLLASILTALGETDEAQRVERLTRERARNNPSSGSR